MVGSTGSLWTVRGTSRASGTLLKRIAARTSHRLSCHAIWERINIGVFLLWVVVLAITLLPAGDGDMTPGRQGARPA